MLRPWRPEDAPSIARHADDPQVAANLRDVFPCPYQLSDAEEFIRLCRAAEPEQAIVRTDTCDILPSNILLSGAELEFNRPGREFLLKTALSKVEDQYDYIIIDTPPALSLLTVNAYVATDSLIIPMSPEILSLLGVSQIKETIESVRSYYNSRLRVLGILLNKFSARLTLNREVLEMAAEKTKVYT